MSDTETQVAPFVAPEGALYTDRNGNVRQALVLTAETDEAPASLRVLRNHGTTTMLRVARFDAESGTYKTVPDAAPELPTVVSYTDHNGNVRPAVVLDETEGVKLRVLRNNGTTYVRTATQGPDGTYTKVPEPSFGYSDYDADDESDEDSDSDL